MARVRGPARETFFSLSQQVSIRRQPGRIVSERAAGFLNYWAVLLLAMI